MYNIFTYRFLQGICKKHDVRFERKQECQLLWGKSWKLYLCDEWKVYHSSSLLSGEKKLAERVYCWSLFKWRPSFSEPVSSDIPVNTSVSHSWEFSQGSPSTALAFQWQSSLAFVSCLELKLERIQRERAKASKPRARCPHHHRRHQKVSLIFFFQCCDELNSFITLYTCAELHSAKVI